MGKYLLAILISMFLWNYAGQAMTAKDDIANVLGVGLYFAIVCLWIWLIGRELTPASKANGGSDHCGCGCSHHNEEN